MPCFGAIPGECWYGSKVEIISQSDDGYKLNIILYRVCPNIYFASGKQVPALYKNTLVSETFLLLRNRKLWYLVGSERHLLTILPAHDLTSVVLQSQCPSVIVPGPHIEGCTKSTQSKDLQVIICMAIKVWYVGIVLKFRSNGRAIVRLGQCWQQRHLTWSRLWRVGVFDFG